MDEDLEYMIEYFDKKEREQRKICKCKKCGRRYLVATKMGEVDKGYCDLCRKVNTNEKKKE